MSWQQFITGREIRSALVLLVVLLLIGLPTILIASFERFPLMNNPLTGARLDLRGAEASKRSWPSSTPHKEPWPAPISWQRTTRVGQWHYDVRADNPKTIGGNGFSMDLYQSGWPLPVLEDKQMWWDWDNPAMKGPSPDPPMQILYGRLTLSVLFFAGGLWLVIILPWAGLVIGRRLARALGGRCIACGYDIRNLPVCPECGRAAASSPA